MHPRSFLTSKVSVVILLAALSLVSCRAQQARRSSDNPARRQANAASAAAGTSRTTDSVLMVQQKLLQLIDTMADVMERDRGRIRDLEIEIARLKSILSRYGVQGVNDPIRTTSAPQSYYSPPASRSVAPQFQGASSPASVAVPAPSPSVPGQQLPVTGPTDVPSVRVSASVAAPPTDEIAREYSTALQAFNQNEYQRAIDILTRLRREDPFSSYAPNYEYWRGESFYALGQFEKAIESFTIVLTQFPGSGKSDDADFKIAESYLRIGDQARARNAYDRLLALYPDSEYRTRAETRLRTLRN